ncbi:hypothetical protein [Nocardioides gilvus]|uniref:hypothetical protein n=1 Tax=Nocardioides gilvus TaxID=1735589 RepID=UPI000D74A21C|nr:hypothetical protein [Nocardioides gilvus]
MARPTTLELIATDQPWRTVPMDGANLPLDVVPLASGADEFVILARFPAGFVRDVAGGYHAAETFLVIDGQLTLEGHDVARGDLTHVPAEQLREDMRTEAGCLALAWFSGAATFVPAGELGVSEGDIRTVRVLDAPDGVLIETPEAVWSIELSSDGESIDTGLSRWILEGPDREGPLLTRTRA